MNCLLIAEEKHYCKWPGKTYYDILTHYKEKSSNNVTLIFTNQYKEYSLEIFKSLKPSIIIYFDTTSPVCTDYFSYVFDLNIPVFYVGLDLFYLNIVKQWPTTEKYAGIIHFSEASKLEKSYKLNFPDKIITHLNGRYINSNRYKNYNNEKIYDILLYGTRYYANEIEQHIPDQEYKQKYESFYGKTLEGRHNFYPLRRKLEDVLKRNTHKYKLHILKEACIFDAPIVNENLSNLINKSWLTVSCCTRADIAMAKYFEIPASYSAILGDIPSDYEHLFKDNIVEVTEWMTDEEIINIIDKALENKEKLWEMTKRLGDRVHKEYNLDAGVKDMDEVFRKLLIF